MLSIELIVYLKHKFVHIRRVVGPIRAEVLRAGGLWDDHR